MFVVLKVAVQYDNDGFYSYPATTPEEVVYIGPDLSLAEAAVLTAGGPVDPKNVCQRFAGLMFTYENK